MRLNFDILAQNQGFLQRTMIRSATISANRCRNRVRASEDRARVLRIVFSIEPRHKSKPPPLFLGSCESEGEKDVGKLTTRYRMDAAAAAAVAETGCCRLQEAGCGSRGSRQAPGRAATRRREANRVRAREVRLTRPRTSRRCRCTERIFAGKPPRKAAASSSFAHNAHAMLINGNV